jgi:hypothetical protein
MRADPAEMRRFRLNAPERVPPPGNGNASFLDSELTSETGGV